MKNSILSTALLLAFCSTAFCDDTDVLEGDDGDTPEIILKSLTPPKDSEPGFFSCPSTKGTSCAVKKKDGQDVIGNMGKCESNFSKMAQCLISGNNPNMAVAAGKSGMCVKQKDANGKIIVVANPVFAKSFDADSVALINEVCRTLAKKYKGAKSSWFSMEKTKKSVLSFGNAQIKANKKSITDLENKGLSQLDGGITGAIDEADENQLG